MTKFCPSCGLFKTTDNFYRRKISKDGFCSTCKKCNAIIKRKSYLKNYSKIRQKQSAYWQKYKLQCDQRRRKLNSKKFYLKHKKDILSKLTHKRKTKEYRNYCKKYRQTDKFILWRRKYHSTRYKNDIHYKIQANLRRRTLSAISGKNKSTNTLNLLGCSILKLKAYLSSKFLPKMSWNNYGQWHIDHIKPCSAFDLTIPEEQAKCFHYTNLQPLWATTEIARKYGDFSSIGNIEKGNKI